MDYDEYLSCVKANYSEEQDVVIERYKTKIFYEENFDSKWLLGTKVKVSSFVTYVHRITEHDISHYSDVCFARAVTNRVIATKYRPRDAVSVFSFNLLVSEKVSAEAIEFVKKRPKKHYAAMEMPIIFDLSKNKIYYYEKTPMWGRVFYKSIRKYIEKNFNVQHTRPPRSD
ncbi:MAG: hypothetical protein LBE48_02505 [Methanomassiliicoccaceae archaeon]|jgi:hypothetical protein|nr:hypothetical protein [Methanomassiliicoccaceae archaeon]